MALSRLVAPTVVAGLLLVVSKRQPADVVHNALDPRLARRHLAGRARVARWNVHGRVLGEEVARAQEYGHWFGTGAQALVGDDVVRRRGGDGLGLGGGGGDGMVKDVRGKDLRHDGVVFW